MSIHDETFDYDKDVAAIKEKKALSKLPFTKKEVSCERESQPTSEKFIGEIIHCKRGKFDQYIGRPKSGAEWGLAIHLKLAKMATAKS